jgi:outer membrane protein, multidrug efflux system
MAVAWLDTRHGRKFLLSHAQIDRKIVAGTAGGAFVPSAGEGIFCMRGRSLNWATRYSNGVSRFAAIIGGLGVVQLLHGCTLQSEKPDLALDTPGSYRAAQGLAEAALPSLDWWRGFRSRELTMLIEEAQAHNFDIAIAIAQIKQADAQARIAGAPLLPTIDLNGSANVAKVSGPTSGAAATLYSTSLSASYIVDFWGKNQATLVAAQETAVASRYNREVVALTAVSAVATTYFQVLGAEDRLRIARGNLKAASGILDLIRQQFGAGTVSQINVAQQQALVETQRAAIPPLEETRQQQLAALAVLIGRMPERFSARGGSMARITIPRVTPGLPSELLNQRPDLREAEALLASGNYSVQAARAAFFPTIQLTGAGGFASKALQGLFGPGAWFYTLAAGLTQPVFDGFLLEGQLELQLGLRQQYLEAYRKAVLSAFANVEQALVALEQTTLQERYQRSVVRASKLAFDLSEQQLRQGTANLVSLLQVEETLFQADDTLAQVQLSRLLAAVALFQALGGGWSPPDREAGAAPSEAD